MTLAPTDPFPERVTNVFEAKTAPNTAGGRGPMRVEEGVASDTDVPNDFTLGARQGYMSEGNHNAVVWHKGADEVMRERAHVGSAAWVEAPEMLGDFSAATGTEGERAFVAVTRSGGKYHRQDAAVVQD
jgi:hypothetical protein